MVANARGGDGMNAPALRRFLVSVDFARPPGYSAFITAPDVETARAAVVSEARTGGWSRKVKRVIAREIQPEETPR